MLSGLGDSPASEFYVPTFRNTLFHLQRRIGMKNSSCLPAYEDGTLCCETVEYKIQMPENHPEGSMQHSEQGESLNQEKINFFITATAHSSTKHY